MGTGVTGDAYFVELAGGKVLPAATIQILVGLLIVHGRNVRCVWTEENELLYGL